MVSIGLDRLDNHGVVYLPSTGMAGWVANFMTKKVPGAEAGLKYDIGIKSHPPATRDYSICQSLSVAVLPLTAISLLGLACNNAPRLLRFQHSKDIC